MQICPVRYAKKSWTSANFYFNDVFISGLTDIVAHLHDVLEKHNYCLEKNLISKLYCFEVQKV